ncbi:MAG: peptidoglycan-binding protein [Gammaproteobacteria bacterium]|nr:peptidoglycan-binding protein [Gammaproteobacteria bacterium]
MHPAQITPGPGSKPKLPDPTANPQNLQPPGSTQPSTFNPAPTTTTGNTLTSGQTTAEKLIAAPTPLDTALASQSANASSGVEGLSFGDRGAAVTDLQTRLNNQGYNPGTIDGIFGQKTRTALENFQSDSVSALQQAITDAPPLGRNTLISQLGRLQQELTTGVSNHVPCDKAGPPRQAHVVQRA